MVKNIVKNVQFVLMGVVVLWCIGCSEDDDALAGSLSVISVKLNDVVFTNDMQGVPLNSTFEIVFSSTVEPEIFENALYISAGQEQVPFTTEYLNQSTKVLIGLDDMTPNTAYTINVDSGRIGVEGKILQQAISYSFTTENADTNAKAPCLSASEDCMQRLEFLDDSEQSLSFDVYSNYDFIEDSGFVWGFIDKVVVVVHGANRDADNYYNYMVNSLQSMGMERNTLAPVLH